MSTSLQVTIDSSPPTAPAAPDLQAASDSAIATDNPQVFPINGNDHDDITNVTSPTFDIAGLEVGGTLELLRRPAGTGAFEVVATRLDVPTAALAIQDPGPLADGDYEYAVRLYDVAGNLGATSGTLKITIDTTAPMAASAPDLQATSDTGISNSDDITARNRPTFDVVTAEATAVVRLLRKPAGARAATTSRSPAASAPVSSPITTAAPPRPPARSWPTARMTTPPCRSTWPATPARAPRPCG